MPIACAADFADWYDGEARQYTDKVLTDFVERNPHIIGVVVAAGAQTAFDLGSIFFVDIARLGSGAGDGTAKGVFEDILRLLSVIPVGKVAAVGKPILGRVVQAVTNTFYWRKLVGRNCTPISVGQALQFTGQRLVTSFDEIAAAMGRTVDSFDQGVLGKGASINEAKKALTELKAVFEELPAGAASGWGDLKLFAEGTEGVFLVPLKRVLNRQGRAVDTFHTIMVSKTSQGVQIYDRKGVFQSLDDLSRRYGSTTPAEFYNIISDIPLIIVKNWVLDPALARRLNAMGPLGAVAVKVAMALSFNPGLDPSEIRQKFNDYIASLPPEALYPPPVRPPDMVSVMGVHEVGDPITKSDWLSSIAARWYGDSLLWPILWEFNKADANFKDPNKVYKRQRIKIPFINQMPAAEIAAHRQRGKNWQAQSWK